MNNKIGRGRGRGRGRGLNNGGSSNPWSLNSAPPQKASNQPGVKNERQMIDMKKYEKLIDNFSASDSSDEEIHNDEILSKLTKNFDDALESRQYLL